MATSTVAGEGKMGRLLRGLVAALAVASASAQTLSTFPQDDIPTWQQDSVMKLQVTPLSGGLPLTFDIVPFTRSAGLNLTDAGGVNIYGTMEVATESTYVSVSGANAVAYLCCDHMNSSFITPEMMLSKLMDNNPAAILLYSVQKKCCGLDGISESSKFRYIYTMTDVEASASLVATNEGTGLVTATITGNNTSQDQENAANQNGNNSAVAMSILYSITGLITLLFLIIIATGAIRAHRYPERYGPRSGYGGRPRQSRAKGIARAVLETLPIVKFGSPQPTPKPDPALELEEGAGGDRDRRRSPSPETVQVHHLSTIPEDAEAHSNGGNTAIRESRLNAATAHPENAAPSALGGPESLEGDEHLGCSICTEDFLVGEDVRVLPCDHKFHPPCIDPWLVNVSGTCPLCRLDLRPNKVAPDGDMDDNGVALPPPLEPDADGQATTGTAATGSNRSRRSSRFFDLNRLRHASAEERIEALRRYRTESRAAGDEADPEEHSRTSRLTHRLKDRFRIRTRAQSPPQRRRISTGPGQIA